MGILHRCLELQLLHLQFAKALFVTKKNIKLECGPMPNVMAVLPNRWCRLSNAAKFGWRPLLEYRAVTLPRCEPRWNLRGCPKLANRSQPVVDRSSPYCGDIWRRYCCLTCFFRLSIHCLNCEDIARQSCGMVPRWRLFGDLFGPAFPASRVHHISDLRCILNSH